ncbi:hypothetical protein, partial [Pasteurella multocida]|uniref:hypothetical protein n=1 Tax=Pasteurella multocida TaxID=747 RepID=UPI001CA51738
ISAVYTSSTTLFDKIRLPNSPFFFLILPLHEKRILSKANYRIHTDAINSVIEKQRKQLQELNQKREQLEMMLKWREGLES